MHRLTVRVVLAAVVWSAGGSGAVLVVAVARGIQTVIGQVERLGDKLVDLHAVAILPAPCLNSNLAGYAQLTLPLLVVFIMLPL